MNVVKPIFIIGTGRSGSTAFFDLLSKHSNTAWLSGISNRFPDNLFLSRLYLRFSKLRFVRAIAKPSEAYHYWDFYYKGFSRPIRDLEGFDVTAKAKIEITSSIENILFANRNRFLCKITGWSRIGFLKEIFPDAVFIHVSRDGKAVVNSLLNVPWWEGWRGPSNWNWGELSREEKELWEKYNKSFVALAAIQWSKQIKAINIAKAALAPENYLEIRYTDLCENKFDILSEVLRFCELPEDKAFHKDIIKHQFVSQDDKWKSQLSSEQQKKLSEIIDYLI